MAAGHETVTAGEPRWYCWSVSVPDFRTTSDKISLPLGPRVITAKPGVWLFPGISPSVTVERKVCEVSDFVVDDLPAFGQDTQSLLSTQVTG